MKISHEVIEERIGGDVMILSLVTERFYTLNESGAALWDLVKSGANSERLAEELIHRFNIPADVATADASRFIEDLVRMKILSE